MNHDSPAEIRAELERRGLTLKKRWGQNFLINRGARDSMVGWLSPMPADRVWEIGPGLGAMTELLLKKSQAYGGLPRLSNGDDLRLRDRDAG